MARGAITMGPEDVLRLIEQERWAVSPQQGGGWVIDTSSEISEAGDADVLEIARTRGSLTQAVQMAWANASVGKVLKVK